MATQRYISTSFWDDSWVQSIDPSEKLMYLYLMTNPLTNIAGIYKITDKRIHDDTGFNVDMVNRILDRFEKARKSYRQGEYIIIPTWPKHQKWKEKKTIEAGIRSILSELPKSIRDKAIEVHYQYPIDSVPVSYIYEPSYSDIDSNYDSNIDSEPVKPVKAKTEKKQFMPPTIEEVQAYIKEKQFVINPTSFHAYYSSLDWKDGQGKQVQNWKLKAVQWNTRDIDKGNTKPFYAEKIDVELPKPKLCPKCGGIMRGAGCTVCFSNFDEKGNEI